tara:strand:+ start:115 stop:375 length:261 start_codon:yes stop_codon:yes gene_type:complete
MPFVSTGITVGTTAVQVAGPSINTKEVHIQSASLAANIYAGGPDVTSANGILISGTASVFYEMNADDRLFCVSDSPGNTVKVLEIT